MCEIDFLGELQHCAALKHGLHPDCIETPTIEICQYTETKMIRLEPLYASSHIAKIIEVFSRKTFLLGSV